MTEGEKTEIGPMDKSAKASMKRFQARSDYKKTQEGQTATAQRETERRVRKGINRLEEDFGTAPERVELEETRVGAIPVSLKKRKLVRKTVPPPPGQELKTYRLSLFKKLRDLIPWW